MRTFRALEQLFDNQEAFGKTLALVPVFYYFAFFIAFQSLEGMNSFIARGSESFVPRFPIFWARFMGFPQAVQLIFILFVFGTLCGAIFPRRRTARIGACLGFLEYHALLASFGSPNHQWDLWLWVAFLLLFLPDVGGAAETPPERRKAFLMIFWGVQAFILLTYTMSGIGKIAGGVNQFLHGEAGLFSSDAAALHATTLLRTMRETVPLAPLIVRFPLLGWLGLIGVVYLELFSFLIAFRPSLHRPWAALLVLFHVGTYLGMRAVFVGPAALLMIFFFDSPFRNVQGTDRPLTEMPLIGPLIKKFL